jgi:hypothetical protein
MRPNHYSFFNGIADTVTGTARASNSADLKSPQSVSSLMTETFIASQTLLLQAPEAKAIATVAFSSAYVLDALKAVADSVAAPVQTYFPGSFAKQNNVAVNKQTEADRSTQQSPPPVPDQVMHGDADVENENAILGYGGRC